MTGWLRRYTRPASPRLRLVCFPHAGGSANFYRPWRIPVPPDVELVALQYPGRQDRLAEPPLDDMDELVAGMLADLERLGDLPAVFLGHSMGASVAYEAVRRLSWRPDLLVVSAGLAPSIDSRTRLHLASDAELLARLEMLGGLQLEALSDPELRSLVMPALRADYRVIETYRAQEAPIDVGILAVVGDRDPEISIADIQAWQHATAADFTLMVLPGGHFYLNQHAQGVVTMTLRHVDRNGAAS